MHAKHHAKIFHLNFPCSSADTFWEANPKLTTLSFFLSFHAPAEAGKVAGLSELPCSVSTSSSLCGFLRTLPAFLENPR